jgi:hypothetical protein
MVTNNWYYPIATALIAGIGGDLCRALFLV